jgi:hypothetical protein
MWHDFVTMYRDAIISRARDKMVTRSWPYEPTVEPENAVPLLLTQLSELLRLETTATPSCKDNGASAVPDGRHLRKLGFSVSQVIHGYGDICQAITEVAFQLKRPLAVEEFQTLDHCLDNAIAEAVTEHARLTT